MLFTLLKENCIVKSLLQNNNNDVKQNIISDVLGKLGNSKIVIYLY